MCCCLKPNANFFADYNFLLSISKRGSVQAKQAWVSLDDLGRQSDGGTYCMVPHSTLY